MIELKLNREQKSDLFRGSQVLRKRRKNERVFRSFPVHFDGRRSHAHDGRGDAEDHQAEHLQHAGGVRSRSREKGLRVLCPGIHRGQGKKPDRRQGDIRSEVGGRHVSPSGHHERREMGGAERRHPHARPKGRRWGVRDFCT